ncbi:DUF3500 domain-containing protein [Shouchella shacheensis]|uniref:DUF3500 domain-containing protein n=1 Tax=Shouchella shacheensis TaxID=1649580 RepID=UPI0007400A38|nr:DUF3500 domain-containing protein [Shouchella shacheensis]
MKPFTSKYLISLSMIMFLLGGCQVSDSPTELDVDSKGEESTETLAKPRSQTTESIIELVDQSLEREISEEDDSLALANAFLGTLTEQEREDILYQFTAENAARWSNLPASYENRNGLALGDLSDESVIAALALVKSSLSEEGFQTLAEIMKADAFLKNTYKEPEWGANLYFIALVGTPSKTDPWMIQFSGHHLAENIVVNAKEESATPQFTGIEPQPFGWDEKTVVPLEPKQTAMYAMLSSFSEDQLKAAKLSGSFEDVAVGPGKDGEFPASEGIRYTDLAIHQQAYVKEAMKAWVTGASNETAGALLDAYFTEEALADTYIGWAGSRNFKDPGSYIRIDGPRVWIEISTKEGVADPENLHFHTVWRDKLADYGGAFTD